MLPDSPVVTRGGTVDSNSWAGGYNGLTEGVQVLAFTGQVPIVPIAGLAAVMAGLAMVAITLSKRQALKWKHAKIGG